ncbi:MULTISPECIES: 3-isopropylmalate dehydratase small subunit [unclassified Pseudomonas]|jgi:3-isopropylmalate/(R)-2-methylmalate dehydratase small subunit|uniref:3-isopropylmalate dehydratase small subunit n=1 Tax=unclassified Pseudomonas TaxID=196821 RepID=UPI000C86C9B9|nr:MULTISPECIES: 3-isopropylmalate dehydratase small subunit [unclassified Pseudomonas]PMV82620.1 3-isopropylmalate dehydratase small subunit [Pseudomonas sp. GW101-1A09]PMV83055.1 3-isopropylmalate dehydratase small subunit [Pseudomonas sp. FW306-2-2C-B10A]PMV99348.1 3-isopropylmalate dehydratase small subunit [Pseudomonas sp. MPR-TSA4]PMW01377.1 3-isopropylmalate dehydratase small subunit [Pseudomonas sp. GW460-C8]PMW11179.1 3-isopropylmalate dehydratase small subunit [Pseudomonas sp. GW456-
MSLQPFTQVTGQAAPMLAANIDTDVIMPKQFLKGIDRAGLDRGLFFDLRFLPDGSPNPEFVLNQPAWQGARFMVVGPNFGCGSSREHAVWGLRQMGIRALIGSSFAGIFYDNCQRNGVLLITLEEAVSQRLGHVVSQPDSALINVDLEAQEIRLHDGKVISFEIDTLRKTALLLGLDAIGSTLQRSEQIKAFERNHLAANPWLS